MATINLGAIKFNWKGAYNSGTSYAVDDVVSSGGNSYVCIQAHSNQAVGDATAYWNIMSSAGTNGTNGTDLTTTLTTQGDLVYRDGSGLQRLGAGTSGQVLQTGGAGANPSWGTVSSDFVKIQSTTVSSNVSSVTLTGFDDSVYSSYLVRVNNAITEVTGVARGTIKMRVNTSGGVQSGGSDYQYITGYIYRRFDNDSTPTSSFTSEGDSGIVLNGWSLSANDAQNTEITFANPQSTSHVKIFNCSTTFWKTTSNSSDGPYIVQPQNVNGIYTQTTALTGLTFLPESNGATAIAGGNFCLYGLKK